MNFKKILHNGTEKLGNNIKNRKISPKKIITVVIIGVVLGFVALLMIAIIAIFAIRWAWNSGSNAVQQNPTISSVLETTQQEVSNALPNISTSPTDFITNNQIDTQKITETYNNLPTQTQELWKATVEQSISESIQNATGADLTNLQQLLTAVQAL